jgi:hypothetical protein
MQTVKSRLVLSQYREGSEYADKVGSQYHFPRKYYNLLTLPDIEFIYYEPKRNGEGVYFGYGEVGKVDPDPNNAEQFFAEIVSYRPFGKVVPAADEQGKNREQELYKTGQMAVRQIDTDIFESICQEGGIELASLGIDSENSDSDDAIKNPFDPSKIKVDREPMSVFQVLRKIELGEIQLNPDFQRNLVWDNLRRCRLVESALLRLPLPAFYFDGVDANHWTVVDGLQRLTTLHDFITKKSFRLQGLEYLGNAEGKSFDELPRGMQRDLEETQITLFIIRPNTPPDVKFTIFYRINTGGLVLTSQEIRHALFQGKSTMLLKTLASSEEFLQATDWGVSDARMDARECVLRYLAFHLHSYQEYGKSDLNGLLSGVMKELNDLPDSKIAKLDAEFREAMTRSREILGRRAFRKYSPGSNRRGPVNKALFESWANVLQAYDLPSLRAKTTRLREDLGKAFWNESDYTRALSAGTGSVAAVKTRFERAHEIVKGAIQ